MASFDLSDISRPRVSPAWLVGATSPLWPYFSAVAAGGVAYWWMTRWTRPVNLEAMMAPGQALSALTLEPVAEAADAVVQAAEETQAVFAEALLEDAPLAVGGESAPVGVLVEAAPPEPEPEPVIEAPVIFAAPPEPVIDEPVPVTMDEPAPSAPKPRSKKAAAPASDADA